MLIGRRDGYTLMELLTVIAIIAVLAGLIFPVAAGAKRKARQAQCINNMYQIFTAIKQFQLDEHRYPDFIAGPVQWNTGSVPAPVIVYSPGGNLVKLEDNTGMMGGTTGGNGRLVALYPEYIPNFGPLKCPFTDQNGENRQYTTGNPDVAATAATSDIEADPMFDVLNNQLSPPVTDALRAKGVGGNNDTPFWVYKYSSYDYQKPPGYLPEDLGQIHYSTVWKAGNNTTDPNITRQLKWRTPPEDTVITWCSHHRNNDNDGHPLHSSKDIVLFLDGHVKQDASIDMEPWATKGWLAAP